MTLFRKSKERKPRHKDAILPEIEDHTHEYYRHVYDGRLSEALRETRAIKELECLIAEPHVTSNCLAARACLESNPNSFNRAYHYLDDAISCAQNLEHAKNIAETIKNAPPMYSDPLMTRFKKCISMSTHPDAREDLYSLITSRMTKDAKTAAQKYDCEKFIDALNRINPIITTIEKHFIPFPTSEMQEVYENAVKIRVNCLDKLGAAEIAIEEARKLDAKLFVEAYKALAERGAVPVINIHDSVIIRSNIGSPAQQTAQA